MQLPLISSGELISSPAGFLERAGCVGGVATAAPATNKANTSTVIGQNIFTYWGAPPSGQMTFFCISSGRKFGVDSSKHC